MMAFVLSDLGELLVKPCPVWPCMYDVVEILISAIVGAIIGHFLGRRARETHSAR